MYTPGHFTGDSADALALMRAYPFATLITSAADGTHVTHLPLLVDESPALTLRAHMARANPHWRAFAQGATLAVFHGPHAYISPSWYVQPDREVPTWNYAAVHAHGTPALIEDRGDKLALIDASVATFEAGNTPPWTRKVEGERLEMMLGAIVAFEMKVGHLEAKFKMNQNRTADDRAKVIAQLRAAAHPDLQAMAAWMQAHEGS
ncbi:MAG TPA: FMN-binding negative transcriptional regulator [Nevskiaceae bacterium]|nr:FMN-binding negative transcriptional regulator [Nevskiaceae bacterium]